MRSIASRLRPRLSFANVVSVVALMVALGGTSYAISLGKNSVGSREIAKNAVRTKEVRDGALGRQDLNFDALARDDLAVESAAGSDPVTLPTNGDFVPLTSLSVTGGPSHFLVSAFAQASAATCPSGAVRIVARVTFDGQTAPGYPDMRLDLNSAGGNAAAPIGLGGLFDSETYRSERGTAQPHNIELLARAEGGVNTPNCAQVVDRNVNAVRLSE